jgi:putative addiction module component (TIGR02574 family)
MSLYRHVSDVEWLNVGLRGLSKAEDEPMSPIKLEDIRRLSVDEKLVLLELLWQDLSEKADALPVTPAQREEIDRRLDDLDRCPDSVGSIDQVKVSVRERRKSK